MSRMRSPRRASGRGRHPSWSPRSSDPVDWVVRATVVAGSLSIGGYAAIAALTGLAASDTARWGLWATTVLAAALAASWAATTAMMRGRPALGFVVVADIGIAIGLACLGDPFHADIGCALYAMTGAFACFLLRWRGFLAHLVAAMTFVAWIASRAEPAGVTVIALSIVMWVVLGLPIVVRVLWTRSEQTARLAFRDPLTGAANRAGLERNARLAVAHAARRHLAVMVVVVDLDRFKSINDRFGHPVGDAVIIEAARHLFSHFGSSATVARSGGEEFTVLAIGTSASLTASMQSLKTETPGVAGPPATMSVGAVMLRDYRDHPEPLAAAMFAADARMYGVKASGGNGCASTLPGPPTARRTPDRSSSWSSPSDPERLADVDPRHPRPRGGRRSA